MVQREESDSMGTVRLPQEAYYGAQTYRAVQNFPVSDLTFPPAFIVSLALIKKHAALVNQSLDLLEPEIAGAVVKTAQEVMEGRHDDQFVVDLFQTGSGTSTNMNMNEVIATRSNELLTGEKKGKYPVHPNDHVNLGQSSNDTIPTAMHIAGVRQIRNGLYPALKATIAGLSDRASVFADIKKIGRTHLQDAVMMTLGQEFSGYARQLELGLERLQDSEKRLTELALGGTAVGTGINAHPEFSKGVIRGINEETGLDFKEANNHFSAQAAQDTVVETSGQLKTIAVSLMKIANDIRWLSSGPRCGLGEIEIPSLQPGSSIMPGKVNPVIPEAVIQVAAQVIGNDSTITVAGQSGNLELNVMLPVMAYNFLQSIALLSSALNLFNEKCIRGITANQQRIDRFRSQSLALATNLVPYLGYDEAARIAKEAFKTGKTIEELTRERQLLPEEMLKKVFD